MNSFTIASNLLTLRTNADQVAWSFGFPPAPDGAGPRIEGPTVEGGVRADYVLTDLPGPEEDDAGFERYHYWMGARRPPRLRYSRPSLGRATFEMRAEGFGTGHLRVEANRSFDRFVKVRLNNLHGPGWVLTDLVISELVQRGWAPLHASAIATEEGVIVLMAAPNSGKTLTAMNAVMKGNSDFVCEDIAFTNGKTIIGCPWTSTFRYYGDLDSSRSTAVRNWLIERIPAWELVPISRRQSITDHVPLNRISFGGALRAVVMLERRPGKPQRMAGDEVLDQITQLNRYEFKYLTSPILAAAEYFGAADLDRLRALERSVIARMAAGVEAWRVPAESAPGLYRGLLTTGLI